MNILVVDDSVVFRSAIKKALETVESITKIQVASNGKIALDFLSSGDFDLITLDMEMPVMDGIQTIEEIRKINKSVPIVIFASPTLNQAEKTLKALSLGANDFVTKIEGANDINESIDMIKKELLPRLKAFHGKSRIEVPKKKTTLEGDQLIQKIMNKRLMVHAIFLGSSTGGPDLWRSIFTELKDTNIRPPMFLVQHMPPVFTKQFARMLDGLVPFSVKEAEDGELVKHETCYIAPGDFHMTLKRVGKDVAISLNQKPKVCYVRPAVDCLFETAMSCYGTSIAAFVLTGMGEDGLNSCRLLKKSGVPIIIQDEESSSVWGMPGAIASENLQDATVPGIQVADLLKGLGS